VTLICGLEHDGAVWLAGDSSLSLGEDQWALCREPRRFSVTVRDYGAARRSRRISATSASTAASSESSRWVN
jgi:hypothetical protein